MNGPRLYSSRMLGKSVAGEYAGRLGRVGEFLRNSHSRFGETRLLVRSRVLIKHRQISAVALCVTALLGQAVRGDAYDPPVGYYDSATDTGATLKGQLNNIIDSVDDPGINDILHTPISYDALRTALQVSDADPTNPARIIVVYNNRVPITKPTSGSIPGWDNGVTWNREHSWPQARGVDTTSAPDGSDMHHVLPSIPSDNSTRGNLNFGGVFGQQPRGTVNDGGTKYYPGDLDAGLIARGQFYMAVRYDGTQSGTQNLELATGNPSSGGSTLGDLNRLIEWHFAAPPDTFERRRNDVIYEDYQDNRNPFVDRPEYAWSVFMDQANNSRITINGATTDINGGSTMNVNMGRVFRNTAMPTSPTFNLNNTGNGDANGTDGTYFEVTTAGLATSTIAGRNNAFRSGVLGGSGENRPITVGLDADTSTLGQYTGAVTVNNLDITTAGGAGRGANDADDVFNVSLTVLDHATPSFADGSTITSLLLDFGTFTTASTAQSLDFSIFNRGTNPAFTANMDFDSMTSSGDTSILTTNAAASAGSLVLAGGASQMFTAMLSTLAVGSFSATYTLNFSDEDIAGALNSQLLLTLTGTVLLAGDYNRDGIVDSADYLVWRKTDGTNTTAYNGADGDGNGTINDADLALWYENFGEVAQGAGSSVAVPEPASILLAAFLLLGIDRRRKR